jgi:hypothetical protein
MRRPASGSCLSGPSAKRSLYPDPSVPYIPRVLPVRLKIRIGQDRTKASSEARMQGTSSASPFVFYGQDGQAFGLGLFVLQISPSLA